MTFFSLRPPKWIYLIFLTGLGTLGVRVLLDSRFEVKWKGVSLSYTVFAKDKQRVTHAAITENKHLSAVLTYAKEIQDKEGAPKAKPAGKQRTRYKPTGRKSPGRKSFVDRHIEAKRAKEKAQPQGAPS